jgi:hypothetical protein
MTPEHQVDLILSDCFFAVGQTISALDPMDYDAIVWLRNRYTAKFLHTITHNANVWPQDRDRLMAVSRYLGQRVAHHAAGRRAIDTSCVTEASAEVEAGCRMKAAEQRAARAALTRDASRSAAAGANS